MPTFTDGKWIKRIKDRSIHLELQFENEFYTPSTEQRAFLNMVETIEPIFHKQAAAIVLVTAHTLLNPHSSMPISDSTQQQLFNESSLHETLDRY